MKIVIAVAAIFSVLDAFMMFCCCVVAGKADREEEAYWAAQETGPSNFVVDSH